MVDPDIFNDVQVFSLLEAEERQILAEQVSVRRCLKDETIYHAGDPPGCAYLVQRGRVQVSLTDIAHEVIIVDIVDQGGLVGMSSLLADAPHMTTAVAIEESQVIEINSEDISTLLTCKPLAGLHMMTMIEKQLRATHELMRIRVTRNPNTEFEEAETWGERLADIVAKFGGSWTFVGSFFIVLVTYTMINLVLGRPWDPYPFILLNLFLSMLAAVQAPIIMMSQNRQDAKDRVRSELDYQVNLKAELEIGELLQRVSRIEQRLH